jgi:hypothetical protein
MRRRLAILVLLIVPVGVWAQVQERAGYFPEGVFDDPGQGSSWYPYELRVLGEPSLYDLSANPSNESYRFLWLRTFDPPVAIRLDVNADGTGTVMTKIADGEAGYPTTITKVAEVDRHVLTREQVQAFAALVDKDGFWSLATDEPSATDKARTDGSEWILEAARGGSYNVVARWSPANNSSEGSKAILEIGKMAIDLAQLKVAAGKMY